ncbi:MAG: TIGR03915 family putative DNA repair protein [Treponema sp.]|nr:TIGR03915 family putative DNA repair protein [Treponema sp.]
MKNTPFDRSLKALFDILDGALRGFSEAETENRVLEFRRLRLEGMFERGLLPDPLLLAGAARDLYGAAPEAYGDFVSAWMSERPVEAEMIRFGVKALESGQVPCDRGDSAVCAVLEASFKAAHETDRLMGLLRFAPVPLCRENGVFSGAPGAVYAARCAPDHYVLPGLAGHFALRFGGERWAVVDERRGVVLVCEDGRPRCAAAREWAGEFPPDPCADLWRLYHRSINNESRNNADLQRQYLPVRYRKYLAEFDASENGEQAKDGAVQGTLDL